MENSIGDRIEEKYTRYLNCETDTLELTIEEAIFILETDESLHYVEDLLQEAYKVILSEYKRVLKENEELRVKWDKDTHILQNKLDYANADRIDLAQQNKELRKENEELNYKLHSKKIALEIYNRYIPKSKVEEKIGELNKAYEDSKDENGESEYYYPDYTIRVLEGLLEKRK